MKSLACTQPFTDTSKSSLLNPDTPFIVTASVAPEPAIPMLLWISVQSAIVVGLSTLAISKSPVSSGGFQNEVEGPAVTA